ncbi:hypothetical protein METBIDRAFT_37232 [Metschnikowia bicuspidata var. bicuspidata NRRL YB-4993]|uniref:Uncharacterized protein n=1 Tax=Metschnikowia bicuspidata var. bicuspidata NRRL YB-4993 TaxID=869754 RepID=A0A1A0HIZ7_9ASCO|nr:hypothetical protein METBIDRAFT_37232 [Metschnikowia bicuspidata var. bicuspidata NRRL YB-4993]OBA23813.1 hypothetical protein METBIDRAFT_37232 [Metschnikowia bicuspidata var. bicuspidata NRRL YB-4993]
MHTISASLSRRQSSSPTGLLGETASNSQGSITNFGETSARKGVNTTPAWSNNGSHSGGRFRLFLNTLWQGPIYVRDEPPRPIQALKRLEELPQKLKRNVSSQKQLVVLACYLLLWLFLWTKALLPYLVYSPVSSDGQEVISLTCGQADQLWKGKNAACGLDSKACRPLSEDVIVRCPALCDRGSWLYSLRAVGADIVKYRGYFVGGGRREQHDDTLSYPYRADSFPCGAAVHLGIVSPFFGGCARMSYSSGAQAMFRATPGHYGVSDSIGFDSVFPFSYVFRPLAAAPSHCRDPRLLVLLVNVVLGGPVVYLAPGAVFYWTMAIVGFWTIVTATDPPVLVEPADPQLFYELVSLGLERFLPTCFILYVLWVASVRRTFGEDPHDVSRAGCVGLSGESPLSRLFLWYPLFWLGVLNNITFDRLPVDRLTWHDLQEQPGALVTVMVVALLLVGCVVAQAYYVWLLGRFWRLLLVYGAVFAGLFVLATLPGLTLRIHHYIFGLVFIPGCSTRGRTAYAFQGILLGLFLSGVARWGYASIAETNLSLLRGEPLGRTVSPQISGFSSGSLHWHNPELQAPAVFEEPRPAKVSLLVNDVERFRGESNGTVDIAGLLENNDELRRLLAVAGDTSETPLYLRLAEYLEQKHAFGDYTRAAVLKVPSFEFEAPPPGIT